MFNKKKFSDVLKKINDLYNNQRDFAETTGVNRAYLSQYMNQKLESPPTPKILAKIAKASKGIVTYEKLMEICGHIQPDDLNSYLLAMLGLTKEDMVSLDNQLNKLRLSKSEKEIVESALNEMIQSIKNGENFDSTIITKKLKNIPAESKKNILLAFRIYTDYIARILNFATIRRSTDIHTHNTPQSRNELVHYHPYNCPVYGQIKAGTPNWAEQYLEGYLPIDPNLMNIINPEECFFLRVDGESMNKVIKNGAFALIRKTDWVENGEIAVVLVNGDDATLKKFTKQGDLVILEPESNDPSFTTQVYGKDTEIRILGKYIGKMEMNN